MLVKRGVFLIILACCSLGLAQSAPNTTPVSQANTPAVSSPQAAEVVTAPTAQAQTPPAMLPQDSNTLKSFWNKFKPENYIELGKFILTVITAIVIALWAIYKWRHRKGNSGNPITINNNGHNPDSMLDKFIEEARRTGKLEGDIDRLKNDLANALNRVKELEKGGQHDDAVAALHAIRKSGNAAKLQAVLIADRDLHKDAMIERNREISAVAYLRGDIDIALAAVDEILKLLPCDLDALNRNGRICQLRGNLPQAVQYYEKILLLAKTQNNKLWQAVACGNLGNVYLTRGELEKAVEMYNKALTITEKLGRQEIVASIYANLGIVYKTRGGFVEAEEMFRKSLVIFEKLGGQEGMTNAYGNLGVIYDTRNEFDKAVDMYNKALAIAGKLGRQEIIAKIYGNLGSVHQNKGELDKAVEMYNKALAIDDKLGDQEGMASDFCNLGVVYRTRGELDKAEDMYNKSLAIAEKLGIKEGMAIQYRNLGNVYRIRGDKTKAREYYLKALELYRKIGIEHTAKQVEDLLKKLDEK